MPIKTSTGSDPAWPEAQRGGSQRIVVAVLALCSASILYVCLPSSAFRARALVAVTDIASPLSTILPRAAADASVSEPVILRAAQSLIGTNVPAPAPDVLEQVAVILGIGGAHATGQEARLAADLVGLVSAKPGDVPGSLEISARAPRAERASQIATAVAEALVADQDDMIAQARRKRDIDAIALLERLRAQAAAAHRRLTALGGTSADPTQIRAAAAAQTANAQARVDAIRAIIASGTPPLSDRRDVPTGIETLQNTYLDLTRQLAKARETLGDRHTTIISLQDEMRHAATNLTAEWRRLGRLADAELTHAHQREAALRTSDTPADATRRDSVEDARRSAQVADEAVIRAQTAQHETPLDERSYRLVARAALPTAATGLGITSRAALAGLLGAAMVWLGLHLPNPGAAKAALSRSGMRRRVEPVVETADDVPAAGSPTYGDAADNALRAAMQRRQKNMRTTSHVDTAVGTDEGLIQSLGDLLPALDTIVPEFGAVPTVMVAANEMAAGTMPVALALGRAAIEAGYRVLVVEAARSRGELATAADADADPVLIDLFGVLRVALPAKSVDGFLFLAPSLEHGARIASALARQGETPLVDDIAAEFDLIVIDGGRAADSAAAGWGADAFVRVGRFAGKRDDDLFAAAFGVPTSAMLGTILASVFAPKVQRKSIRREAEDATAARDVSGAGAFAGRPPKAPSPSFAAPLRSLHGRPSAPRRSVGTRFGVAGR